MQNHNVAATIEARMTSSRLPGKGLLPALGEPMLLHLVCRLRAVPSLDEIVIATTINVSDQPICEFAERHGIKCFRGSEEDVLGRVIGAARSNDAQTLVQITGDCPVIDPDLVEQTIQFFCIMSAILRAILWFGNILTGWAHKLCGSASLRSHRH